MRDVHFLNSIFSPEVFSVQELDLIIPRFKKVKFKKNTFLLEQGKTANDYWFVESGILRSFVLDSEYQDISNHFYFSGDIVIDWPSFFLRAPTMENIQALTNVNCWELDYESFQLLFNRIEAFREQGRHTLVSSYFALKEKSNSMITDPAIVRYQKLITDRPQLIQNVSLKQIATYLGITDTSLSRIRKQLATE